MIVSQKHKLIFRKTKRIAGTSNKMAHSKHCGPDDILKPISSKCEVKGKKLSHRPSPNAVPNLTNSKASYQREKTNYRALLSEQVRKLIAQTDDRKIAVLGYQW